MSWTSPQVVQNGNTVGTWVVTGSPLSDRDAVVIRLDSGTSGVRLEHTTVKLNPLSYSSQVRIVGAGAAAFRFSAEVMDN
jgi:hypothetical protein